MKTAKEFLTPRFQQCDCGEIYKSRNLTAPDCVYCNYFEDMVANLKEYALLACQEQRKICSENVDTEIDSDEITYVQIESILNAPAPKLD